MRRLPKEMSNAEKWQNYKKVVLIPNSVLPEDIFFRCVPNPEKLKKPRRLEESDFNMIINLDGKEMTIYRRSGSHTIRS